MAHATRLRHTDRSSPAHVSYGAAHGRVHKARGPASDYPCVRCGGQARDWAYDHADPDVRYDVQIHSPFSLDPNHYQPMCVQCHRRFDCGTDALIALYPIPEDRPRPAPGPVVDLTDLRVVALIDARRTPDRWTA